jgi:hypothetical protein
LNVTENEPLVIVLVPGPLASRRTKLNVPVAVFAVVLRESIVTLPLPPFAPAVKVLPPATVSVALVLVEPTRYVPGVTGDPTSAGPTTNISVCVDGESCPEMFRFDAVRLLVTGVYVAVIGPFAVQGTLLMMPVSVDVFGPAFDPDDGLVEDPQVRLAMAATVKANATTDRMNNLSAESYAGRLHSGVRQVSDTHLTPI